MTPLTKTRGLVTLLVALSLSALAEVPRKQPLARYASLWTSSSICAAPLAEEAPPAGEAPKEPIRAGREIEELKMRIAALEAEVRNLKAAQQRKEPIPRKQADAEAGDALSKWQKKFEPGPVSPEVAIAALEQVANREAQRRGLAVKRRVLLPTVEGGRYDRARIEVQVSGGEQVFYQWLDRVHSPADFRGVTRMQIDPGRDDESQVVCRVQIESWFVPEADAGGNGRAVGKDLKELRPLLDAAHYPIELMLQVAKARPEGSTSLQRVEIVNQHDLDGAVARSVRLRGTAAELAEVNSFNLALKESAGLEGYAWTTPPPVETKSGHWSFAFEGVFAPGKDEK